MKRISLIGFILMFIVSGLFAKDLTPKDLLLKYIEIVENDCSNWYKTGYHLKSNVKTIKALMYKARDIDAEVRLGHLCGNIAKHKDDNRLTKEQNEKYKMGYELYDDTKRLEIGRLLKMNGYYILLYRYFSEQQKDDYDWFEFTIRKEKVDGKWKWFIA